MDVSVLYKRRQRSPRSTLRASILGEGLLERTRSTSLALLGLTAAIGLAMVALALNQGWPLIAGAPIPGLGSTQEALGEGRAVATTRTRSALAASSGETTHKGSAGSSGAAKRRRGGVAALAGLQGSGAANPVVSHPTPASPPGSVASEPVSAAQQPAPTHVSTPAPATDPAVAPAPGSSVPPSVSVPQATPESPVPSQAPVSDEGDERGHGHHHGRSTNRGRGRLRSEGNPETSPPDESSEPAPVPAEAPPVEADASEEAESGPSQTSLWGRGGGRHYGHDRGRR
jgi:hypothetical protein